MRKLILTLLLAMTSASAESQSLTFSEILAKPELTTTQPDHKIAYGKDALQYGELWLPPSTFKGSLPVVVLIHGGCWRADLPGPELVSFLAVFSCQGREIFHGGSLQRKEAIALKYRTNRIENKLALGHHSRAEVPGSFGECRSIHN